MPASRSPAKRLCATPPLRLTRRMVGTPSVPALCIPCASSTARPHPSLSPPTRLAVSPSHAPLRRYVVKSSHDDDACHGVADDAGRHLRWDGESRVGGDFLAGREDPSCGVEAVEAPAGVAPARAGGGIPGRPSAGACCWIPRPAACSAPVGSSCGLLLPVPLAGLDGPPLPTAGCSPVRRTVVAPRAVAGGRCCRGRPA